MQTTTTSFPNTDYQHYHESKQHTSDTFPYNTYLCSIPLDFSRVPIHWHKELELIVIQKGCGSVTVDFHTQVVSAGEIVLILPGQLHAIEQKGNERMEYENILFRPSMLMNGANDLCAVQFIEPLLDGQIPSDTFLTPALSYYSQITDCIRQIDALCSRQPQGYQLAVKGLLFRFLYFLISEGSKEDRVDRPAKKSLEKMKTILAYIKEHYQETIRIDDMAALTYYSKSHFMKFFKTHMGMGFIEYLNDYRLNMAAELLLQTDDNILDIAAQIGFENLSYFNRLFHRKFGAAPGQYRRQHST